MGIKRIDLIDPNDMISIIRDNRKTILEPTHSHEFIELEYVLSGSGIQIINGTEYSIKRGDVLFFNIGDQHSYYSKKDLEIMNCIFHPRMFEDKKTLLGQNTNGCNFIPTFMRLSGSHILEVEELLIKIEKELNEKSLGYYILVKSYLSALFTILIRNINNKKPPNDLSQPIIDYLEKNYKNVTLTEIAKHFNFSRTYFCKYFKNVMGITFSKYINTRKIHEAIRLIQNSNQSIESICYNVGFKDKKQFYKSFKEYTGITPNAFRNE